MPMKLIDKSALVAEITHKIKVLEAFIKNFDGISDKVEKAKNKIEELGDMLLFIESLEVKEVDLEKEIDNYLLTYWNEEREKFLHPFLKKMCVHFFELGLLLQTETNITFKYNIGESVRGYKAQKGEEV